MSRRSTSDCSRPDRSTRDGRTPDRIAPDVRHAQRGLYLITPQDADTPRLVARVEAVLPQASWLQYRNKVASRALQRAQILALLPLCRAAGVPLIVNDDWRLAVETGAEGVHLGAEDGSLGEARSALGPDALLGASCYDDIARAERACAAGADYIAFGAFFASSTKPLARRVELPLLQAAARLHVTRVAIGGITPDNAHAVIDGGADLVAVISGVFDAPDPVASARAYRACFD